MPINLAIFGKDKADGWIKKFPSIKDWFVGGHSLGGTIASGYLGEHKNEYEGLILLGSYSIVDFSSSYLSVFTILGSEDKILNRKKYEKNKKIFPQRRRKLLSKADVTHTLAVTDGKKVTARPEYPTSNK